MAKPAAACGKRWPRISAAFALTAKGNASRSPPPATRPTGRKSNTSAPRRRFPELSFEWLNLVYACHRCNRAKDDSWPGFDDEIINQLLSAEDDKYTPVSKYVSPNAAAGQRSASEFFSYDVDTGEILPSSQLPPLQWSMARRTIRDVDLNDSQLGENDSNHLWRLRRAQLDMLRTAVNDAEDDNLAILLVQEFTLPDSPFSSFMVAYIKTIGTGLP